MNSLLGRGMLRRTILPAVALLAAGVSLHAAQSATGSAPLVLVPGGSAAEIQIPPADTQKFVVPVPAGKTVILSLIEKQQTSLVTWTDGDGKAHTPRTNRGGRGGTIRFTLIGIGGDQQFSVTDANKMERAVLRALAGAPRPQLPEDAAALDAEESLAEGEYLWSEHTPQNSEQALAAFDRAIRGAEQLNDIPMLRAALTWKSVYLSFTLSRPKDALPLLIRSTNLADAGDVVEQADAWKTLGFVHVTLADYADGWEDYTKALDLFRKTDDLFNQEVLLENRSDLLQLTGSDEDALRDANAAANLARTMNDEQGLLHLEDVIGAIDLRRGELQAAFEAYQSALGLEQTAPSDSMIGFVETDLARLYHRLGAPEQSNDMLARANSFWAEHPYLLGQVNTLIEHGRIETENGDQAHAITTWRHALALAESASMKREEVFCLLGLGTSEGRRGETAEAEIHLQRALQLAIAIREFDSLAAIRISDGDVALSSGNPPEAVHEYALALDVAARTFDHAQTIRSLGGLANAEFRQGHYAEARGRIDAALDGIEDTRELIAPGSLQTGYFATWHSYYDLAVQVLMQLAAGKADSDYVHEAFLAAERGRARSMLDDVEASGGSAGYASDPALIASRSDTLRRLRLAESTLAAMSLSDARSKGAESLESQIAELKERDDRIEGTLQEKDSGKDTPVSLASDRALGGLFAGLQNRLDDATALLEYWVGSRDTWLWIVTTHTIRGSRLCATAALSSAVRSFQRAMLAREESVPNEDLASRRSRIARADGEAESRAELLGRLLVPADLPAGVRRLVLVPDGILASVPFAALRTGSAGYLIGEYELVEEPSAAVAVALLGRPVRSNGLSRIAVFADPVYNQFDPRLARSGRASADAPALASKSAALPPLQSAIDSNLSTLPRLKASSSEADAIASIAGADRVSLSLGFDATPARVMSLSGKNYSIVDFAAHAIVDSERPELSGIVLSMLDDESRPQDGVLWLHDIYSTHLPVSLVVLSGCGTAGGKSIPGEGIASLAQAFLSSGAGDVIGTLWTVDDASSGQMIPSFYQALFKRQATAAGALREAQLKMLAAHRPPYDWAGYEIEGNWKTRVASVVQ